MHRGAISFAKNNLARATCPGDRDSLARIHQRQKLPAREALGMMTASLVRVDDQ